LPRLWNILIFDNDETHGAVVGILSLRKMT